MAGSDEQAAQGWQQPDQPHQQPLRPGHAGNGMAVAALVLGIVACVLFWTVVGGIVLGLLAVIFGILGARRARRGRAPHHTMAVVGAVLGALGLVVSAVLVAIGASLLNSDDFKNFDDCVKHADSRSDRDQCAKDFGHDLKN